MTKKLTVKLLPSLITADDPVGKCVVMTDVLRASTSIVQATAGRAKAIYPVAEIKDALQLAVRLGPETLIGGERGGKIVPGFNCGNSPREYVADTVADKNLVLCTSNGTYTLDFCKGADRILIGAFVNLSAVCSKLVTHESCMIACAGTDRRITGEDVLFAGAVTEFLLEQNAKLEMNDGARIAVSYWREAQAKIDSGTTTLAKFFASECLGGVNLIKLGYEADIEFCSQIDLSPIVPVLDEKSWSISRCNLSVMP